MIINIDIDEWKPFVYVRKTRSTLLAMFSREERQKRETKTVGQFREMVNKKLGKE